MVGPRPVDWCTDGKRERHRNRERGLVAVEAESGVMSLQGVYKRGVQHGSQLKDPSLIKLHGRPLPPKLLNCGSSVMAAQNGTLQVNPRHIYRPSSLRDHSWSLAALLEVIRLPSKFSFVF